MIRYTQITFAFIIAVSVLFWKATDEVVYPADVFPRLVLIIILLTAGWQLIRSIVIRRADDAVVTPSFLFSSLVAFTLVFYVFVIEYAGYYLSTVIYLFFMYLMVERFKKAEPIGLPLIVQALVTTMVVTSAIYLVFTVSLKINVPTLMSGGPF